VVTISCKAMPLQRVSPVAARVPRGRRRWRRQST
jgi:hypothetical protein